MRNLYEILGVQPTATLAEIRSAYRKESHQHHPDAGGTREAFEEISIAHDTLCDEDARAFYDQTGHIKGRKPEGADNAEMLNMLAQAFDTAMNSCHDPERVDIVATMREIIANIQASGREEIRKTKILIERLVKTRDRMKVKTGDNFFVQVINGKIAPLEARIAQIESAMEATKRAYEFLKNYEFDVMRSGGGNTKYEPPFHGFINLDVT